MITSQKLCGNCPEPTNNLELIATRFQNGLCFLELECHHCNLKWTAEVSMPSDEDFMLAAGRPDLPKPSWRVVDIVPADREVFWRQILDCCHTRDALPRPIKLLNPHAEPVHGAESKHRVPLER